MPAGCPIESRATGGDRRLAERQLDEAEDLGVEVEQAGGFRPGVQIGDPAGRLARRLVPAAETGEQALVGEGHVGRLLAPETFDVGQEIGEQRRPEGRRNTQ
jgi:hypothetical protein